MTQPEYENKKRECWEEYCQTHPLCNTPVMRLNFDWTFDRAYALGKQEKDAEEITIDKYEYEELCKYRRYAANWAHGLTVCPICGEFNPSGCICANCDNNKDWNK